MKRRNSISTLLTVLGFSLAVITVWLAAYGIHAAPKMTKSPETAVLQVRTMMDAVCSGDYATASAVMCGTPSMGSVPETQSPAVNRIWDAYRTSFSYNLAGECYATETGAAIDVTVKSLDISAVLNGFDRRVEQLLKIRMDTAESASELYDGDGGFRQELIDEILHQAVSQALEAAPSYQERSLTLPLVYEHGQWWVVPNAELQDVLSGSF